MPWGKFTLMARADGWTTVKTMVFWSVFPLESVTLRIRFWVEVALGALPVEARTPAEDRVSQEGKALMPVPTEVQT